MSAGTNLYEAGRSTVVVATGLLVRDEQPVTINRASAAPRNRRVCVTPPAAPPPSRSPSAARRRRRGRLGDRRERTAHWTLGFERDRHRHLLAASISNYHDLYETLGRVSRHGHGRTPGEYPASVSLWGLLVQEEAGVTPFSGARAA